MSDSNPTNDIDYEPLAGLIGVWKSDKDMDISPEPERLIHKRASTCVTIGNKSGCETGKKGSA